MEEAEDEEKEEDGQRDGRGGSASGEEVEVGAEAGEGRIRF